MTEPVITTSKKINQTESVKTNVANNVEQNKMNVQAVRAFVKARMDFQHMRKAMSNRIGKKADGTNQDITDGRSFMADDVEAFKSYAEAAKKQEAKIARDLEKALKRFPIYNDFLSTVKGVGPISAGWIIGNFNIDVATTVSKMWQYAGLNPGNVRGKKRISKSKHKGEPIFREVEGKDGNKELIVLTDEMVKGDRPTPGFVLPYNKPLRTALVGVMADGFIKAQSPYCLEFYYPYKNRLEQKEASVTHLKKDVPWMDVSKGHRDRAAKRYMIKMFIKDLYVAWRTIEGLPVREPYQVEYLGHKH